MQLNCPLQFNSRRSTYVGSSKTKWDGQLARDIDHSPESTRSGVVEGNERCRGLEYGKPGTCTAEARKLHNEAEAEEEGSCEVHRGLVLCMERRKGSVLDRSAAMNPHEQIERVKTKITLTSGW